MINYFISSIEINKQIMYLICNMIIYINMKYIIYIYKYLFTKNTMNSNLIHNENKIEFHQNVMELHLDDIEEISININDWLINQNIYSSETISQQIHNASNLKIELQQFIERFNNNEYAKKLLEDFTNAINIFGIAPTIENFNTLDDLVCKIINILI